MQNEHKYIDAASAATIIAAIHGIPIADLVDTFAEIPAADVAPVRHGRWISLTDCANAGVYCSECKKKVWKEDYAPCNRKNKLRSNYCPNCGARMDGEAER
ncbi:MAG: hypothetical protein ACI4NU_09770 [Christensenellales bacterium]